MKKEIVEIGSISEEVNMAKIAKMPKNRPTYYRVDYQPMDNHKAKSTKFNFIPGDTESELSAFLKALKFRDKHYLINHSADTKYSYMKIRGKNENVHFDCFKREIIKGVDGEKESIVHEGQFKLLDYPSFNQAMGAAIKFVSKFQRINPPLVITYDYAFDKAKAAGYKPRKTDVSLTTPRIEVGQKILCPKTNDEGLVTSVTDDFMVVAHFTKGEAARIIKNDILYANLQETRLDKVNEIKERLAQNNLTEFDRLSFEMDLTTVQQDIDKAYALMYDNKRKPQTEKGMRNSAKKKRSVRSLITIADLKAIEHKPSSL